MVFGSHVIATSVYVAQRQALRRAGGGIKNLFDDLRDDHNIKQ